MEYPLAPKSTAVSITGPMDDEIQPCQSRRRSAPQGVLDKVGHEVFRHDYLDRKLKRHHITGNFVSAILLQETDIR